MKASELCSSLLVITFSLKMQLAVERVMRPHEVRGQKKRAATASAPVDRPRKGPDAAVAQESVCSGGGGARRDPPFEAFRAPLAAASKRKRPWCRTSERAGRRPKGAPSTLRAASIVEG